MSAYRLTSVAIACAVAALVLGVVVMASLALGSRQIAPNIVWESLVHGGTSQDARVVLSLRVPRTIAALIIGGALGLAGSIMQAIGRPAPSRGSELIRSSWRALSSAAGRCSVRF